MSQLSRLNSFLVSYIEKIGNKSRRIKEREIEILILKLVLENLKEDAFTIKNLILSSELIEIKEKKRMMIHLKSNF